MADVFISYAREDQEFARELQEALEEHNRNTWIDWKDIPLTAKWKEEVFSAIEQADSFAAVISPDYIVSKPCQEELDHAALNNKRMVPLWHRDVADEDVPRDLAAHQYVYLRENDDFEDAFERLLEALDTDMEWVHFHTLLLVHAKEWEGKGHDSSMLLRGGELREAEEWQARAAQKEPKPTSSQSEYILASRRAASRRYRATIGVMGLAAVFFVVLAALSFWQWREARSNAQEAQANAQEARANAQEARMQANIALSRQLLAQASELQESQADASLLLNLEALRRAPAAAKEEARSALLEKLARPYHVSTQLTGHIAEVNAVAFSPDGKLLASASGNGTVRLWDVATGKPHGEPLEGHTDAVNDVAFSPDGELLSSASNDRTVRLWDVATGKPRGEPLTGHTQTVYEVAFGPKGKLLASASADRTARLWEVESRQPLGEPLEGHYGAVNDVAFSPDGKLLASAGWGDYRVRLWEAASRQPLAQLTGHTKEVSKVAFGPDGELLASASADGTVRLWDMRVEASVAGACTTANRNLSLDEWSKFVGPEFDYMRTCSSLPAGYGVTGHTDRVYEVAFSPDGELLASSSGDKTVRLWDVATGKQHGEPLKGHTNWVLDVAFGPEGELLASASVDMTVRLWDMATGKPRFIIDDGAQVHLPNRFESASHYVTVDFEPAFSFDVGQDWQFGAAETHDQVFIQTGPKGGQLLSTNPRHVFDPANLSEPKELPAPENTTEWVSWFQRHPNLETSKPIPVSVGGASGKLIDVTASSTPENYPKDLCGKQPCVPVFPISDGSSIVSYEGWKDRFIIVEVEGETVLIDVAARAEKFDAFSPTAQEVLDSVEWKGGG